MHKFEPCYISDVEGEVHVDFEIDVPDFVVEVPGPTGPCFDLGGGGVSIRAIHTARKRTRKRKKIQRTSERDQRKFSLSFFLSCVVNVPYLKAIYIKVVFTSSFSVDCSIGARVDT